MERNVEIVTGSDKKKIVRIHDMGENRKEFSHHTGIRTPPEYIPRLIEYQMKYEKLVKSNKNACNRV